MKKEQLIINSFRGEYNWLSNMYPCSIYFNDTWYSSVEHAYQHQKNTKDATWFTLCTDSNNSPYLIKSISKRIELLDDNWDDNKVDIMTKLIKLKFSEYNDNLMIKLLKLPIDVVIVEGNYWGDDFWGVDLKRNKGMNVLGNIIMDVKYELHKNLGEDETESKSLFTKTN